MSDYTPLSTLQRAVLALSLCLTVCAAQSALPREVLLLSRVRHHTESDLAHLPNFTCLETIERSSRTSPMKPFDVKDVVRVEVAHVGEHELFAWPGASNFENRPLEDMVGSGMTSNGEYSAHARAVFVSSMAVIHYSGDEDVGGHHAARYDYEISPAFSGYTVHVNRRTGVVGVRGSFWADTTSFDLLRLTVEGTDIPLELGIRAMLTGVDYGRLHLGSGDYLLPQSAEIWMGLDSGLEKRNRVDFTHCRQYATESVLSFDAVPEAGAPAARQATIEFTLPAGLLVPLHLETPIEVATAKVGDAISASLSSDLKQNGQLIAPKGTIVSGRLRVFEKQEKLQLVGLEFTDLTFENRHARFLAALVSTDSRFAPREVSSVRSSMSSSGHVSSITQTERAAQLPGVGTFFLPAGLAQLPKGMAMEWKTEALGK